MTDEEFKRDAWYSSKKWRSLRRSFIARHPLCNLCADRDVVRAADVVDHIIERVDDERLRLDSTNLQSLCHRCHNQKTVEERRKREVVGLETSEPVDTL